MKLEFSKRANGEIFAQIDGVEFSTKDYVKMIHDIHNDKKIEAGFGDDITPEEQTVVLSMLEEINNIKNEPPEGNSDEGGQLEVSDDLPF